MSGGRAEQAAAEVLLQSQAMLELARLGEWAALEDLQATREVGIAALFAEPVPEAAAAAVAEHIERVLELDRELLALVTGRRDEAAGELRELRHSRRGAAAYARHAEPEVL